MDREIARRHSVDPVWQQAAEQEKKVAQLIKDRRIRGRAYVLRRSDAGRLSAG